MPKRKFKNLVPTRKRKIKQDVMTNKLIKSNDLFDSPLCAGFTKQELEEANLYYQQCLANNNQ